MKCNNCGKEIDDDSLFCEFCGAKTVQVVTQEKSTSNYVVLKITYVILVLFLAIHLVMNSLALISLDAYNGWFNTIFRSYFWLLTPFIFIALILYFIYSFKCSRDKELAQIKVDDRPKWITWASKNIVVLSIIVIIGLFIHLLNFWSRMQLQVIIYSSEVGLSAGPDDGAYFVQYHFSQWYYVLVYVIWLVALWFHLTHGFWNAIQIINKNKTLQVISNIFISMVILVFLSVVLLFFFRSLI